MNVIKSTIKSLPVRVFLEAHAVGMDRRLHCIYTRSVFYSGNDTTDPLAEDTADTSKSPFPGISTSSFAGEESPIRRVENPLLSTCSARL